MPVGKLQQGVKAGVADAKPNLWRSLRLALLPELALLRASIVIIPLDESQRCTNFIKML